MRSTLRTYNLESGYPSVPQALAGLDSELRACRSQGVTVLKLIHGYGSTGVGGDLRIAIQAQLRRMIDARAIQRCIFGENWRKADSASWELVKRFPELKKDADFGRCNRGITIVVL